jgi:hypothetical protein
MVTTSGRCFTSHAPDDGAVEICPGSYEPRRPEATVLYQVVQDGLEGIAARSTRMDHRLGRAEPLLSSSTT